jgi:hypothetical protein
MIKIMRIIDAVLGGVLLLIAGLGPWMLGVTTQNTIWLLNGLGFLSGGLWLIKLFLRFRFGLAMRPAVLTLGSRWPIVCVWVLVIGLLSYVLCSALNPKANLQYTFTPGYLFAS